MEGLSGSRVRGGEVMVTIASLPVGAAADDVWRDGAHLG